MVQKYNQSVINKRIAIKRLIQMLRNISIKCYNAIRNSILDKSHAPIPRTDKLMAILFMDSLIPHLIQDQLLETDENI